MNLILNFRYFLKFTSSYNMLHNFQDVWYFSLFFTFSFFQNSLQSDACNIVFLNTFDKKNLNRFI